MHKLIFSTMVLFSSAIVFANDLQGKVVTVIDGNTIQILCKNDETHTVQLVGIDSPELSQEYGEESKRLLEKIVLGKKVTISFKGKDWRGNPLAEVLVNGKKDPRVELLEEGLAWTAEKNPLPDLEAYRTRAQQKGLGLWKQSNPTPPWTHRRQQTMLQPKTS
ncbi:MAG TPA: thermonuclease family protein [Chryseolinea sp.]|nr:thermonuclease family protein [Chryseolinea sp.]